MSEVVVVDYGMGNLLSVTRALDRVGADVVLATTPRAVADAGRLVLPGVGAFGDGMAGVKARGLVDAIRRFASMERPFLGICLGMQMMLEVSEEFGICEGLGLIPGRNVAVPANGLGGAPRKIPHIGWNRLLSSAGRGWDGTILAGLPENAAVYFVHSFMAMPEAAENRVADCDYDGVRIAAAIGCGHLYGCQFHPEKSGPVGLRILENFVNL